MADTETSSTTAMFAIFAILVLIVIGAFLVWQTGLFAGERRETPSVPRTEKRTEIRAPASATEVTGPDIEAHATAHTFPC